MVFYKKFSKISLKITVGIVMVITLAAVFLFLANGPVLAQGSESNDLLWGGEEGSVQNSLGLGNSDPRIIVARIVNVFLGFLGIIAVLLIMYAGFLWMTAGGDEAKITQAKQILTNALIGLVIVLASFGIAAFIINKFFGATNGGVGTATTPSNRIAGGVGALGNCTVEMVYPEPNQNEVPRNSTIIITFREEVNPATIEDPGNPGYIWNDGRIKIYKSVDDPSVSGNWVTNVRVYTSDNQTFVLDPDDYLGSASEYIWYTVYFSNAVEKQSGGGIFDTCRTDYFRWEFEVSNRIDLEPPKVQSGGVFPSPDNAVDLTSSSSAVQAVGDITVNLQPQPRVIGTIGAPTAAPATPAATISNINQNHTQSGTLRLAVESDDVTVSLQNVTTSQLLGSATASGDSVVFPGYFTLTLTSPADVFSSGNSWDLLANGAVSPDTLVVGSNVFSFVSGPAGLNEIQVGGTPANTATNIANRINALAITNASAAGTLVSIVAETAGLSGNNIQLTTSNTAALAITAMHNGLGSAETVTVQNRRDKARNAVIQVNFNEAVNPITLSGDATLVSNYIAVKCLSGADCDPANDGFFNCGGDTCLEGNFIMSNAYRTVEFISNNLCGVNGCGEQIFCLPGNSELRVELVAATFTDCGVDVCASRSPYNNCNGSNCDNGAVPLINFPQASLPLDGVADVALNSLDGDRTDTAEGPINWFNENSNSPAPPTPPLPGSGDNFLWSFFISDKIEIAPPIIDATSPNNNGIDIPLTGPITMDFSKIMMSSSLKTGGIEIYNGVSRVAHRLVNLRSLSNQAVGYWVVKQNHDTSVPPDGEAEYTSSEIRHTMFSDSTSFRAQVGSGVKDIYQNCFKPSDGPACTGIDQANPSCCSGTVSANATCP